MLDNPNHKNSPGKNFEDSAELLINKFSISYLINPEKRYEDVYELYIKSANAYKLDNLWEKAGDVYLKAGNYIWTNPYDGIFSVGTNFETIQCFINGAHCYDKIKHEKRIECRTNAISLYKISGQFERCGKLYLQIAEIYEYNNQIELALENYNHAHQFFELSEKGKTDSIQCLCKYANLYASKSEKINLNKLLDIYNKIIDCYQTINTGKFHIKQYITMSMLTVMAIHSQTIESIKKHYENYLSIDYTFGNTSQGIFITSLIKSLAENNVELFETSCYNYDRVKPLDTAMVQLLTIVKKRLITNEIEYSDEDNNDEVDLC